MILCGNVYIDLEANKFSLKCSICETESRLYTEFVKHVKQKHKFTKWRNGNRNSCQQVESIHIKSNDNLDAFSQTTGPENNFQNITQLPSHYSDTVSLISQHERTAFKDITDDNDAHTDYEPDHEGEDATDDDEKDTNYTDLPTYTDKFIPTFFRKKRFLNDFIDLYKSQHCLWDVNDANYGNESHRQQAEQAITLGMQKFNVFFKKRTLYTALDRLHKLCINIKYHLENGQKNPGQKKISNIAMDYYKRCNFLNDLLFNTNATKNRDYKLKEYLNFYQWNNATVQFIECYSCYPIFYNTQNENYLDVSEREKALEELNQRLFSNHIVLSREELMKAIGAFQTWYYKTRNRLQSKKNGPTKTEEKYLRKCNFMPEEPAKRRLICCYCQKIFQCISTLKSHQYKIHKIGDLPFKCEQCNRTFEQNSMLQIHKQRVHVGKIHQCQYCERRFAVKSDLKVHTRIHTAEKPHVCEKCGKSFRLRTQLGYHVTAIHTKIRAFKCNICPKDFLKKRNLTDHVKTHLNIRDKICETCGKGFSNNHSLIRHRQIHSEVKKFACKLCDARFKQFVGLNGHMKRTHNIVKRDMV